MKAKISNIGSQEIQSALGRKYAEDWQSSKDWRIFRRKECILSLLKLCLPDRYLLNMEGYSYSSRLKYIMACGSAIIYPNKRYTEFW
jgi:hypothetical protein